MRVGSPAASRERLGRAEASDDETTRQRCALKVDAHHGRRATIRQHGCTGLTAKLSAGCARCTRCHMVI
jgi:hypothetical protein